MSKRKIIILYTLTSVVFVLSIMAIFGAFLFEEKVTVTANLGNITTINKGFVTYAPGYDEDTQTFIGLDINDFQTNQAYIDALEERETTPNKINSSSIICYATKKEGHDEEKKEYFYLNQLGFRFDVAASIDVFVKIHFEDAWILEKTVGGNTLDPQYIRKTAISSANYPFKPAASNTDWYYDSTTNSVYYKHVIDSDEVTSTTDESNNYIHSFSFDLRDDYFYVDESDNTSSHGHEAVLVEVSFTVDVVQANRAYAIWGIDPLTIGS